ncbi:MAG: ABC transporter related [Clostridiales bacterium 38_11]|nr:MAG: ABC transporter related [Clostridiales bacterium 38_11]HBH11924.1 ABC transporter ATP-binding protein [Clostridiales bacterium]
MFRFQNVMYKDIINIKSLTIPSHKIVCITGESGGGKTTLLKLLNKMISPDSGEIFYLDVPLEELDSINLRRKVIMLPQNPAIYNGSIKDNLLIGLRFSEKTLENDDCLLTVLQSAWLSKSLDESVDNLSGGEKQRLALARVLLLDPDVFLLDEPSASLDEETERIIIENLVTQCKKNSKSIIMVTHSNKVATTYSDMIIRIDKGRVVNKEGML